MTHLPWKHFINRTDIFTRKQKDFDALLLTNPVNIFYLLGFQSSFCALYVDKEKHYFLITDGRYETIAKNITNKFNINFIRFDKNFRENFSQLHQAKTIGIEISDQSRIWKTYFNSKEISEVNNIIEPQRAIKNLQEIHNITQAQNQVDKILLPFMHKNTIEGISEKELAFDLEIALRKRGSFTMGFDAIIAFGENSALPHHHPSDRILKSGDVILVDVGIRSHGYSSDMTRTFGFKKISRKFEDHYNVLQKIQKYCLEKCTPQTIIKDIEIQARETLGELEKHWMHSLGHGVGLEVHEAPNINTKNTDTLQENQVITIEPGIYFEGEYGIRIEDLVHITENQPNILSKTTKQLIVL